GPLSVTVMRNRVAWLAGGGVSPCATTSRRTTTSGRIPASSQASSALSTASFTHVSKALRGLSKPSRWRFFVKNSETEMSRCRAPISTAVTGGGGLATGGLRAAASSVAAVADFVGAAAGLADAAAGLAGATASRGRAAAVLAAADDLVLAVLDEVFEAIGPIETNSDVGTKFS